MKLLEALSNVAVVSNPRTLLHHPLNHNSEIKSSTIAENQCSIDMPAVPELRLCVAACDLACK